MNVREALALKQRLQLIMAVCTPSGCGSSRGTCAKTEDATFSVLQTSDVNEIVSEVLAMKQRLQLSYSCLFLALKQRMQRMIYETITRPMEFVSEALALKQRLQQTCQHNSERLFRCSRGTCAETEDATFSVLQTSDVNKIVSEVLALKQRLQPIVIAP